MTCEHRSLLLNPGARVDRAGLVAHAEGCSECRALIALHHETITRLAEQDVVPVIAIDRARVWSRIEAGRGSWLEAGRGLGSWLEVGWGSRIGVGFGVRWRMIMAAGMIAGAVAAFVLLTPRVEEPRARVLFAAGGAAVAGEEWVEVRAGQEIRFDDDASIVPEAPSTVLFFDEPGARKMRLFRGALAVNTAFAAAPALEVETPRLRVVALAAAYRVEIDAQSARVVVERGEVVVHAGDLRRTMRAGEVFRVEEQAAVEQPGREINAIPGQSIIEAPKTDSTSNAKTNPRNVSTSQADKIAGAGKIADPSNAETNARSGEGSHAREIAEARALIGHDDRRAVEIVERILEHKPTTEEELEALMIAADANRRAGALAQAEAHYARALAHPAAGAFREEALLRRAAVLAELDRAAEAIALLAGEPARGYLLPERAALEARLRLQRGDVTGAARILDTVRDKNDRVLEAIRAEVARAKNR